VDEQLLQHAGYSGSSISRLLRGDGAAFILKRMSIERDWIMRATADVDCREVQFAAATLSLPPSVRMPTLGAARDGDEYALLMRDITPHLIPPDVETISASQLDRILTAVATLHAAPPPAGGVSWCGLRERLTLLTPGAIAIAAAYGAPVARDVQAGWRLFDRHAQPDAVAVVHRLFDDLAPLLRALDELPPALLHGDLKLDNVGLDEGGAIWLIDWAMTLIAPAAVELGWFLAINSRRLPVSLDDVMQRYADAARLPTPLRAIHDALTVLCGLLLRGWRKALDAEAGDSAELEWWCERALAAAKRAL
jgi:hypothetical protein